MNVENRLITIEDARLLIKNKERLLEMLELEGCF